MSVGVSSFIGSRLTQARKARGLMSISLAELVNVSQPTISLYEKGTQKPKQETLDSLAVALNVPVSFFLKDYSIDKPERLFYRSMSAATKAARARAEARYEWYLEIIDYLLEFFDFPELNIPDLDVPSDFRECDEKTIECIAEQLRQYWLLGNGPVPNMVQTLESNGIVTWRTLMGTKTLDAFSDFREPHSFVVLSSDKENYFRSRSDAGHELGHLILHRNINKKNLKTTSDFKLLEYQANYFSGAFLLPASSYGSNFKSAPSLEVFRSLKPVWNTSIAMQIMRSKQLGVLDEYQEKRLWINLSRRGWKKGEPLDDTTPVECPNLVQQSIKMLLDEGVKTREQIEMDLRLNPTDIEKLGGLPENYISGLESKIEPKLKYTNSKILPFKR